MDAPCKIQGSIHVFRLVNNMCPGKWVHIISLIKDYPFFIFENIRLTLIIYIVLYLDFPIVPHTISIKSITTIYKLSHIS